MPVTRTVNFDWAKPHRDNDPYGVDVPNLAETIDGIDTVMQAVKVLAEGAATQADVDAAVAAVVGAAPETLDTVAELAAAFQNNPDIIDSLVAQLGLKASTVELNDAVSTLNIAINANAQAITDEAQARADAIAQFDTRAMNVALAIAYTGAR